MISGEVLASSGMDGDPASNSEPCTVLAICACIGVLCRPKGIEYFGPGVDSAIEIVFASLIS